MIKEGTGNMSELALSVLLPTLDASSLAEGIRERKFSSCEVVKAFLKRIEQYNPQYNAIVTLNTEAALLKAKEADTALANGDIWGPLHGVPITVKDCIMTKGIRTTAGHKMFENFIPETDAEIVKIYTKAGAIILGKTNCPPLCLDVQTKNPIFGITSNPWDVGRTCGGSSGGEAVAIALGLSPLGIGTDTGGSIRLPAGYCGIYGFKPTSQSIPKQGLIPPLPGEVDLDNHLTVVGPMARSIRDLQLCLQIIKGEETRTIENKPELKIAWTIELPGMPLDDEVKSMIIDTIAKMDNKGSYFEKVSPAINLAKTSSLGNELLYFEFFPLDIIKRRIFWKSLFRGGTFKYYKNLLTYRSQLIQELDQFLNLWDCWLLPISSTTAFPHNPNKEPILIKQNGRQEKINYFQATVPFAAPFNFTGHPSVVLPIGKDSHGMPISIQLVGRRGHDMDLLNIASQVDKQLGGIQLNKIE
jgi:amidase